MKTCTNLFLLAALLLSFATNAQYCMLPGRTPYVDIQPGITNFKLNTINRSSLPVENMSTVVVETGDSTSLVRGQTYTITIVHSRDSVNFPTVRNNIRVWLDYNKNFDYTDAGETIVSADYQTYGTFTASFTVPANAPLGSTMLRATAKMSSDGGHILPSPCDSPADPIGYHGEMEDYKVNIVSASSVSEFNTDQLTFSIFSNPVVNQLVFALNGPENKRLSIELFDFSGRRVTELVEENVQSSSLYQFDMSQYAAGLYFIKVSSGGVSVSRKVVKIN